MPVIATEVTIRETSERRVEMYGWDHMGGWSWFFGSLMTVSWIVLLGLVVYIAVRLAQGDRHGNTPS